MQNYENFTFLTNICAKFIEISSLTMFQPNVFSTESWHSLRYPYLKKFSTSANFKFMNTFYGYKEGTRQRKNHDNLLIILNLAKCLKPLPSLISPSFRTVRSEFINFSTKVKVSNILSRIRDIIFLYRVVAT